MSATDIIIIRDKDNDILYAIREGFERKSTVNISITSDITVRLDNETKKVVGLTIEGFSKILPDLAEHEEYILMERFGSIIGFLNASHLMPTKV